MEKQIIWGLTFTKKRFKNHASHLASEPELIEQLLVRDQTMIIAGEFWIGKTNELLHLMCCFCRGSKWHGLQIVPACPLYITWEGEPLKLNDRIEKIEQQYSHLPELQPWYIRMEPKRMPLDKEEGREKLIKIVNELDPRPEVILLDPLKRTVSSDYIKPQVADAWVESCNSLARKLKCAIIVSSHTNKIIHRTGDTSDTLGSDRVKGAGDLLDGVSAAILLATEKGSKRIVRPDGFSKVEWANLGTVMKVLKARDATAEFPLLKLNFNRELLRLYGERWQVDGNIISKVPEHGGS